MPTCCAISAGDADYSYEIISVEVAGTDVDLPCGECGEIIAAGVRHEIYKGRAPSSDDEEGEDLVDRLQHNDDIDVMHTCLICVEIRNHFSCGGGWIFGQVWEDLAESLFPDMTAGGPCFEGLSPAARQALIDACLEDKLSSGEGGCGNDGAPPPRVKATQAPPPACHHAQVEIDGAIRVRVGWEMRRFPKHETCVRCRFVRPLDANGDIAYAQWSDPKGKNVYFFDTTEDM